MKFNMIKNFIKNPQIYKFATVGITTTSTALFMIKILTSMLGIYYVYSVAIVLEIFVIINFFIHDRWTFSKTPKQTKTSIRFTKFNLVALLAIGLNESILIFLTTIIGMNYLISEGSAMIITFFFNFFASKKIIYR